MNRTYLELFPYQPRPIQERIMDEFDKALAKGGHAVIEAGTGSGKTVSALVPALVYGYSHGKRIVYLTRTNSQQRQVILEFRRIIGKADVNEFPGHGTEPADKSELDRIMEELNEKDVPPEGQQCEAEANHAWKRNICVGLQGRANMCPVTSEDPEFMSGTPEELSKMCAERKRNVSSRMSGKPTGGKECTYYSAYLMDEGKEAVDWATGNNPTAEELIEYCLNMGICPYEVTKRLIGSAFLVTAPYIYFFYPFIRRRLMEWMDCSPEDLIIVVDEAHNLAQFIRDISSIKLTRNTIRMAMAELEKWGDHEVANSVFISAFLNKFSDAMDNIAGEYLIDEDGMVPPSAIREEMMLQLHTNSSRLDAIASEVMHHGSAIQDRKKALGKLPRSYIHAVANFYRVWNELEFNSYTPLVLAGRREGDLSLEAFAMDPSHLTSVLGEVHSSVHLSGTLSPLEEYRDSIGLPEDSLLVKLPPPFPLSNRMILYDGELSTNYERLTKDPDLIDSYRDRIASILMELPDRNTALFFPSFDLMSRILGSGELEDGDVLPPTISPERRIFMETRGSRGSELMEMVDEFKSSEGGVLSSVMGGRLSEGMDYPGRSLELVIIVGIPYPKPTARQRALSSYYDIKFGKGWQYTVHAPAARRIMQALGRMIRSEDERGLGYIMDKRAIHFREEITDLRMAADDLSEFSEFFHK